MRRSGVLAGVVAALVLALLAPAAQGSVRCQQSTARDILLVEPFSDARIDLDFANSTLRRQGQRILVLDSPFDTPREAVDCKGPQATVANTASVVIFQKWLSFGQVDLSGGLPAPSMDFRALAESLAYGTVVGTKKADNWLLGGDADLGGVSLDPARRDRLEVTYSGIGDSIPILEGLDGNDRIDATAFARRAKLLIFDGGSGADTILGSRFSDSIQGGEGRDVLSGGGGRDSIDAGDGSADLVDCGPGTDTAAIDRRDEVTGCEKVSRSRR